MELIYELSNIHMYCPEKTQNSSKSFVKLNEIMGCEINYSPSYSPNFGLI